MFTPSDVAIVLLTAALVVLNGYYARQTRQTVAEMRGAQWVAAGHERRAGHGSGCRRPDHLHPGRI
jgi:hypothetical protein